MYQLTCSFHKGSRGNIAHNMRTIRVPHADKTRTELNEIFVNIPIREAYQELFGEALKEYNSGKKKSRQIEDYYEHILDLYQKGEEKVRDARMRGASFKEIARIRRTYQKPYYEVVVGLGNIRAYNGAFKNGGGKDEISVEVLREYVEHWQKRNPHMKLISCVLHRDEGGIPHLHMDYIPFTNEKTSRGMRVRVSDDGALKQQGFIGDGPKKTPTMLWQENERMVLKSIALDHDIEVIEGGHSKRHLENEEYKRQQKEADIQKERDAVNREKAEVETDRLENQMQEQDLEEREAALEDREAAVKKDLATVEKHKRQWAHWQKSKDKDDFFIYVDMEEWKERAQAAEAKVQENDANLKEAWENFKEINRSYFSVYRSQKEELTEAIRRARSQAHSDRRQLEQLSYDIAFRNQNFIIQLLRYAFMLVLIFKADASEREVRKLQEKNKQFKQSVQEVMEQSQKAGTALRSKDLDKIESAFSDYNKQLMNAYKTLGIELTHSLNIPEEQQRNRQSHEETR